jgi:hypothetical protein
MASGLSPEYAKKGRCGQKVKDYFISLDYLIINNRYRGRIVANIARRVSPDYFFNSIGHRRALLPKERTAAAGRTSSFHREGAKACKRRSAASGRSDILEQVEVPLLGAEDHRMDIEALLQTRKRTRARPLIAAVDPRARPELDPALAQLAASGLAFRQSTPRCSF